MVDLSPIYQQLQKISNRLPVNLISSAEYGSDYPVIVQRYSATSAQFVLPPVPWNALSVHIAGKRTFTESGSGETVGIFPSAAVLAPAGRSAAWTYSGYVEFSVFIFPPDPAAELIQTLTNEFAGLEKPLAVTNRLLSALADEFLSPTKDVTDQSYLDRLVPVLIEQCGRAIARHRRAVPVVKDIQLHRLHEVVRHMHTDLKQKYLVADYARFCGISESHFRRVFKQATGESVHRYVLELRLSKARELLVGSNMPLALVREECGFTSAAAFSESFKKRYHVSPSQMRKSFRPG